MLGRSWAVWLGLAACYSPPQPECGFVCGANGECPEDYTCASDGICHLNGSSPSTICRPDAMVDAPRPIDAPPADADNTPPMVIATVPANVAMDVPVTTTIDVTFSEPVINVASPTTFRASINSVTVDGTVTSGDATTFVFTPAADLPAATTIDVQLLFGIEDTAGNAMSPPTFYFHFTTAP